MRKPCQHYRLVFEKKTQKREIDVEYSAGPSGDVLTEEYLVPAYQYRCVKCSARFLAQGMKT